MLSIGWTEMLIVAAIALIVVGPKDLPAMLRQIGKMAGTVRRMGNDFKKELNKVAAIDEIRDIKKSFTDPLNETRSQIESDFNSIMPEGKFGPSGVIKPANPDAESVVDEIRSATGMGTSLEDNGQAAKDAIATAVTKAAQSEAKPVTKAKTGKRASGKTAASKTGAVKAPASRQAGAGSKPATARAISAKAVKQARPEAKRATKSPPEPRPRRTNPTATAGKPATSKPAASKGATAKPASAGSAGSNAASGKTAPVAAAPAKPAAQKRAARKPAKAKVSHARTVDK